MRENNPKDTYGHSKIDKAGMLDDGSAYSKICASRIKEASKQDTRKDHKIIKHMREKSDNKQLELNELFKKKTGMISDLNRSSTKLHENNGNADLIKTFTENLDRRESIRR